MLSQLPSEIIYLIATFLPTANTLARLAQTCKRLHRIISAENWRIFRTFVTSRFPGIETPPFYRDVTQALTSRSRALDKHAIIGRFVVKPPPPEESAQPGVRRTRRNYNPTHGYRPTIDSYELWNGVRWANRTEVLAWGAGHEIVMRVRQYSKTGNHRWFVINDLDMVSSHDDICGLHLLRPNHHSKLEGKEHIIFGRMRGELAHLAISPDEDTHHYVQRFQTSGLLLERIDLSDGQDPTLAAHLNNGSVAFYSTTAKTAVVEPFGRLQIGPGTMARNKYSKFLSSSLFAVGTGRQEDALAISTISSERLTLEREISVESLDLDVRIGLTPRANVSAIAPLRTKASTSPGNVFLAAWGDRAIRYLSSFLFYLVVLTFARRRLHDLRSGRASEYTYRDSTDQNLIYCLHPIGHDRFAAGAAGDAVVKIFDLRMPKTYNYLDAKVSSVSQRNRPGLSSSGHRTTSYADSIHTGISYPRKDFSVFLSYSPAQRLNLPRWRFRSYRGAIYSMSSPSPLSPTIYAGIADGVVRLDFASTDDLTGPHKSWYRDNIDLDLERLDDSSASKYSKTAIPERILELSGYERSEIYDTTRTSMLRAQQPFHDIGNEDVENERLTGWDRRWKPLAKPGAWRRQD